MKHTQKHKKQDIEKLLKAGQWVEFPPIGYSMYPLIRPGQDTVVVEPIAGKRLLRGDVLLYRRPRSILVLHRLVRIFPDGYYFVGDNHTEIEGPLKREQILGRMVCVCRGGAENRRTAKTYSMDHPILFLYAGAWLLLRPLRPLIGKGIHKLKVAFRFLQGCMKRCVTPPAPDHTGR